MKSKRALLALAILAAAFSVGDLAVGSAHAQEEFIEEEEAPAKPRQAGEAEFFEEADEGHAPAAKAAPAKPLPKPSKDSLWTVAIAIFTLGAVSMMLRVMQREADGETDAPPVAASHGHDDHHHH